MLIFLLAMGFFDGGGDGGGGDPTPLPTVTGGRAHTLLLKRKRAGLK